MNRVGVEGVGVVSPAGWGMETLRSALGGGTEIGLSELVRPGWEQPLRVRRVPTPASRAWLASHPRLRRSSPITHFGVASALEALGADADLVRAGQLRLGIIFCVMSGCVNYSRRFYDEVLRDPATASPLLFPETVFNAPASHLAALLDTTSVNYTLVGDPGTFLQGLVLGAEWLSQGFVDGCVVISSEEMDWLTSDAFRLFTKRMVVGEGAGAVYLRRYEGKRPAIELASVTDSHLFFDGPSRVRAARKVADELLSEGEADLLCDGCQGIRRLDEPEVLSWGKWAGERLSPKRVLGEGLMAASAWQCVAAIDALAGGNAREALVSVAGCNQQVIGARFRATDR